MLGMLGTLHDWPSLIPSTALCGRHHPHFGAKNIWWKQTESNKLVRKRVRLPARAVWLHRPPGSSSWLHCNSHKKKSFLLFLTPCLSTMHHLTPDPAFCHFLQGSHCLPNSRHSTGILFSTRFYSTWSLCAQCVWSMGVCKCVCAYCSSAVKTTHRLPVKRRLQASELYIRLHDSLFLVPHLTQLLENDELEHFQLFLVPSDADLGYSLRSRQELERAVSASSKQLLRQLATCSAGTRRENKSYVQSFPSGEGKSRQSRMSISSPDRHWASSGCGQQGSKDQKGGGGGTLTNLQPANPQEQKATKRAKGGLSTLTTSLSFTQRFSSVRGTVGYWEQPAWTTHLEKYPHSHSVKGTRSARHRLTPLVGTCPSSDWNTQSHLPAQVTIQHISWSNVTLKNFLDLLL